MHYIRLILPFFCLLHIISNIYAQQNLEGNFQPPDNPIVITASEAKTSIQIDGKLDEEAWKDAEVISDFFRKEPRQGGKYLHPTEVRILFDEKNLYIGAFCQDSLGLKGVRAQDLRRDFVWGENDIFGVALDPQNLKQYAMAFQTTPYGNQRDFQNFNGNQYDDGWNTLWKVRTQRTDIGYYAEFAIPFRSLRYDLKQHNDSTSWGITFIRFARRHGEQTVFPPIPQAFTPYRMTYAAKLTGLTLPKPSANIRVEPYGLYQQNQESLNGETVTDHSFKAGGEVKWAINPQAVLDLTANTDFAQADVDRAVNNLERFNIFFPERRQFFLENSGIWAGGLQRDIIPFFSRRIGLQGGFNAAPAPIDAGIRYTQRNDKQAVAGLYIHQRETERSQGASFASLRYLKNYGRENNVGVMFTHRGNETSQALGQSQTNNSTLTIDGIIRPKSEWSIHYILSASRDYETNQNGLAGRFFLGNTTNKYYWGWVTGLISQTYNPEMGFVFQKNVIWHNPGGYWIWRPKKIPWIRRWDPGFFTRYYHDADQPGNFQQASFYIFPVYIIFTNGSFFEYAINPTWQNINFPFAPLGARIKEDNYYYLSHRLKFNTDQSRKLSLSGSYEWGTFYNGRRQTVVGGTRIAPSPHFALTADYEYNRLRGVGIEESNIDAHLYTAGMRVAWNPRIQLSVFYQYNSFDKQGRWNARASWEYMPLSFVYLVFNDNQMRELDTFNRQFISKISLVKQF